jgi:hypothetical protein
MEEATFTRYISVKLCSMALSQEFMVISWILVWVENLVRLKISICSAPASGKPAYATSGHDLPIDSRSSAFLSASSCSKYFGLHNTSGIRSEDSIKLLRWLEFSKNVCHISHTTVLQGDCFVSMFRWLLRRIVVTVFFCVRASNVEENVFSKICHHTSVT